ncbi:MAG: RsbRD N-terminal domain-containing protein [Desulfobacterales bacterium]|nr:RsbRD N-terminal domain-containing protein [Desulfobacterales bacterium]
MSVMAQLVSRKEAIAGKWLARVIDTYPPETARFLRGQQDPFANPVGQATRHSLNTLVDMLLAELDEAAARTALDPVIRVRAIQAFTPAQAVGFVFDLKPILRESLGPAAQNSEESALLEDRIDRLALIAFDVYMQCREKIYELKANEMKNTTYKAFARAGLIKDPDQGAGQ